MNKKLVNTTLRVIASVCFLVFIFIEAIDINCFNRQFYVTEYDKLHVAEDIGIAKDELMEATQVLLDYTSGQREDMVVYANIKGQNREVYNQREKDHMVDVRNLYLNVIEVRNYCRIVCFALILTLYLSKIDKSFYNLASVFNKTSLVFVLALGALVLYAACDFNAFWIKFHHVFFTQNDLWLLDPRTDILINMVPEQFFFDLVFKIVTTIALGFGLSNAVAYGYRKVKEKNLND